MQKGDRWLIVRRAAANIQDDPTVGNLQDGWLTMAHDLAIQNPCVEVRRALDVGNGQKMCEYETMRRELPRITSVCVRGSASRRAEVPNGREDRLA